MGQSAERHGETRRAKSIIDDARADLSNVKSVFITIVPFYSLAND
jgi:hypothetical protein